MSRWRDLALALRLLARDWRAGELTLVAAAIVVAVAGATTVGFFADRVHQALSRQANQLLGADLVLAADRPLPEDYAVEAARRGLQVTRMLRFPSMAAHDARNLLAEIKVVAPGYPLRGALRVADGLNGADRPAAGIPAPGTAWVDDRLLTRLELQPGAVLSVGNARLQVAAVITQEPDSAIGFINAGPRVMINAADLAATGLVQVGSRIRYRLQFSGTPAAVATYRAWAGDRLAPGERLESIEDARPEIRSALERAERFLRLTALLSVILAAVAVSLAARRFLRRHLDACAILRCCGATPARVVRLYALQFLVLGGLASAAGAGAGWLAQHALALWLGSLVTVELPGAGWWPAVQGAITGLALLLGFALPPVLALGRVPPLRVLRRDLGIPGGPGRSAYVLGAAVIGGLVVWNAGEWRLGLMVLGGFTAMMAGAALLTLAALALVARLPVRGVSWRFGMASLRRQRLGTVLQVVALGSGIMALLTLTVIRGELLQAWQSSLPAEAPNRFIVNIQTDQVTALRRFFAEQGSTLPELYPMVRGRLTRINERAVAPADFADERARRLVDREFNLSWATRMQADNRLLAGQWWADPPQRRDQLSLEAGIAKTLGVNLGDVLRFDVAGQTVAATVTSLRKVDWDSFHVNFFVVAPPGLLDGMPVSHVTSFYLAPGRVELLNALVRAFPNLLLIDVAQVLAQVQGMIAQVSKAIQFVFLFTLLAGLVVLYAAMAATRDERLYQAAILRTLGAGRRQLTRASLAEFALIGALAGLFAAAGANALGAVLAQRVLNVDFSFSPAAWAIGLLCSVAGITLAGYLGTRRVLRVAPLQVLRDLA